MQPLHFLRFIDQRKASKGLPYRVANLSLRHFTSLAFVIRNAQIYPFKNYSTRHASGTTEVRIGVGIISIFSRNKRVSL